jgi:hypothetical protein
MLQKIAKKFPFFVQSDIEEVVNSSGGDKETASAALHNEQAKIKQAQS